jgi:CRP/FNR family transcriptional regulator, anaerobic regulatory protein
MLTPAAVALRGPSQDKVIPLRRAGARPATALRQHANCSSCAMRHLCMPQGLAADEMPKLEAVICTAQTVRRGATLYRAGEAFSNLYAVRSGSLKTVLTHRDGREQVTGLHLAGEALGLDGISDDRHTCDAVALEDSSVCIIPYDALKSLCRETGSMQQRLHKLMGEQIVRETAQMMLLGSLNAEERVATFLLDVSARHARRGYSPSEFQLRMTRDEMGSYLGMTLETVSRMLSRFQKRGVIEIEGKLIRIIDFTALHSL